MSDMVRAAVVASRKRTLWIKFANDTIVDIEYDAHWQSAYDTFEAFRENFIRGWSGTSEDPVGEPVWYSESEPNYRTRWLQAPEFTR